MNKVRVISQGSPAMVVSIQANRVDAVWVSEPTYSVLMHGAIGDKLHGVAADTALWKQLTGLSALPFLGVSAHKAGSRRTRTRRRRSTWPTSRRACGRTPTRPRPRRRSRRRRSSTPRALEEALKSGRLGLHVQPAVNGKDTVMAALQLAVQAKQVEKVPAADTFFYAGLK